VTLVGLAFATFGLGAVLLGVLVLPWVWAWGGPRLRRRQRCQRVVGACFRLFFRTLSLLALVEFDVGAAQNDPRWPRSRQLVVVANHPTLLETLAVIAVASPICCMVAPWLAKNPLLRPLLVCCGHVLTRGDSLGDRVHALETAAESLREGHSLLVFPEGTRSPPGQLGEFQRGAFELALRAELPLLPVACRVRPRVLTRGSSWYDLPDRRVLLDLVPLDVFEPFDYLERQLDARQLMTAVRDRLDRAATNPSDLCEPPTS
jgi:1-acyl-sn-glycerol-3-phosphate acyltransferase